ncbi:MFS transporter [Halobacteriaceae archaeon GCM10025711]
MVSRLTGPVAKYYVYAATQAAWFVTPVWFIFLLSKDLSYTQMSVLNAVWWAAIVLAEVPTGYLGDRVGRRNGMLLGSVTHLVAVAVFGLLNTFWSILALYAVWGVGVTFRSGSDSAWLYDTLEERMAEDQFTRVKGRGSRSASAPPP